MENEKERNPKFLQSYVFTTDFGSFFVSTCYRQSSAMIESAPWYYETFAWRLNGEERTDWVADHSGARYEEEAYQQHIEVCRQLHKSGKFEEPK
jgi:hypothetical protein